MTNGLDPHSELNVGDQIPTELAEQKLVEREASERGPRDY
jgi:hypothetical protein